MPTIPLKYLITGGALIALLIAIWAWGNSRYNAGEADADAKWEEAGQRLQEQADQSAAAADKESAQRAADEFERVQDEKEKLDAATESGSSPLDVLFGG
jgi:hypothetical protein